MMVPVKVVEAAMQEAPPRARTVGEHAVQDEAVNRVLQPGPGYCDAFSRSGAVPVSCEVDESVADLSSGAGVALYRIAQEAIGNAAKHATPTRVDVRLGRSGRDIVLTVADDGRGLEPGRSADRGLGLVSMRERARQLGGTFELASQPGRGTTVRVAFAESGARAGKR
jgi:signal transduction histidine kinase